MQTYISILRGINVSGHKMVKMSALLALFEGLGFQQVKTYIQSGNVVFQDQSKDPKELEGRIAQKITEVFGFEVPVMVISEKDWIEVSLNNPFVNERQEDEAKLHVTFLSETPDPAHWDKIKAGQYGADEFIPAGQVIYLFCPGGYGNTKLSNNFFEQKLKVVATTRNWKTLNEVLLVARTLVRPNS